MIGIEMMPIHMRILLKFIFNCNASPNYKAFLFSSMECVMSLVFWKAWWSFFLEKGDKINRAGSGFRLQNSGKFTIIHVPRNGIPSCFLFRGMARNKIPRVLLLHGMEFRAFFSSAEWVQNEIPRFLRSAEQAEFRRNKPIFPPIPSSAE